MNQGRIALRTVGKTAQALALAAVAAAMLDALAAPRALGQAPAPRRRISRPSDGPNRGTDADSAAGELVDSLFHPMAPQDPMDRAAARAMGVPATKAAQRPAWSAKLVRNPKKGDGNAPFALIDQFGGVQRYVEPTPQIDLNKYVGQNVTVRRDSGHTLLATQLDLPRGAVRPAPPHPVNRTAANPPLAPQRRTTASGVRLAAAEEAPLVPVPATDALPSASSAAKSFPAESLPQGAPTPSDEFIGQGPAMPSGEIVEGETPMMDPQGVPMMEEGGDSLGYGGNADSLYLDEGLDYGGCPTCGGQVCGGRGCGPGGCGIGSRPIWYVRGEYLLWQFKGMNVPPLVVRGRVQDLNNPTTPNNPLDDSFVDATVVYGNGDILDQVRHGYRVRLGYWLDDYGKWAIEGEYFGFGQLNEHFLDGGNGTTPIVGRPFIDARTGLDAVEDVSFPGLRGTVAVDSSSRFQSAAVRIRKNLCCVADCQPACGDCVTCGSGVGGCDGCSGCDGALLGCPWLGFFKGGTRHVDVLYGFRWAELNERLNITENLTAIAPSTAAGTTFLVKDNFATNNTFLGGEVGFSWDWQKRRWSLEMLSTLAVGSTQQKVSIAGSTVRTVPQAAAETGVGGLLAQSSNIGNYSRDVFSVMPQLGFTAGYLLTDRLKLTAGYNFLYWSRVARPGDQIDTEVNPELFPFAANPGDRLPARPQFTFRDSDLWAHGLNVGLNYAW